MQSTDIAPIKLSSWVTALAELLSVFLWCPAVWPVSGRIPERGGEAVRVMAMQGAW